MGCCGQKRAPSAAAVAQARPTPLFGTVASPPSGPPPPAPFAAAPAAVRAAHSDVRIRYSERSAIRVRGATTGRVYEFSAAAPDQAIDRRDAAALLATGFFRSTI